VKELIAGSREAGRRFSRRWWRVRSWAENKHINELSIMMGRPLFILKTLGKRAVEGPQNNK
jgi:hypothetical protein